MVQGPPTRTLHGNLHEEMLSVGAGEITQQSLCEGGRVKNGSCGSKKACTAIPV